MKSYSNNGNRTDTDRKRVESLFHRVKIKHFNTANTNTTS